jgi:DNA-binding NarL/FixJ family response regulator
MEEPRLECSERALQNGLVEAIRAVADGRTAIQPVVTERVVRGLGIAEPRFPRLEPADPLTDREIEVLRLMTGGYSNREISRALKVAEGTVKNHVSSILSKLGVRDRTRAVLLAIRAGYLESATPGRAGGAG